MRYFKKLRGTVTEYKVDNDGKVWCMSPTSGSWYRSALSLKEILASKNFVEKIFKLENE